jgi:hypothetical protein
MKGRAASGVAAAVRRFTSVGRARRVPFSRHACVSSMLAFAGGASLATGCEPGGVVSSGQGVVCQASAEGGSPPLTLDRVSLTGACSCGAMWTAPCGGLIAFRDGCGTASSTTSYFDATTKQLVAVVAASNGSVEGCEGPAGFQPPDMSTCPGLRETTGCPAYSCNTLIDAAPTISAGMLPDPYPQPQGGTIVDGAYTMTADDHYPGSEFTGTMTFAYTIVVTGSTWQVASIDGADSPSTATLTITTSGTSIAATFACSTAGAMAGFPPFPAGFTATPSQLVLIGSSAHEVATFVRQ